MSVKIDFFSSPARSVNFTGYLTRIAGHVLFNAANAAPSQPDHFFGLCFRKIAGNSVQSVDISIQRFSCKELFAAPWATRLEHAASGFPKLAFHPETGTVNLLIRMSSLSEGSPIPARVVVKSENPLDIGKIEKSDASDTYEDYGGGVLLEPTPHPDFPYFSLKSSLLIDPNSVVDAGEEI